MRTAELDVTVVLAAFNEVGHVRAEVDRITAALKETDRTFEVLVVDDGSTDGTGDASWRWCPCSGTTRQRS